MVCVILSIFAKIAESHQSSFKPTTESFVILEKSITSMKQRGRRKFQITAILSELEFTFLSRPSPTSAKWVPLTQKNRMLDIEV